VYGGVSADILQPPSQTWLWT